ncbi:MAG: DNA recombination protein RmuC [Endomicrobiales bacterium]
MITVILLIIVVLLVALVLWQLRKPPAPDQSLVLLQQQLENLRHQVADSLKNNTDSVNQQLVSIIEQVNKQMNSVTGQMVSAQKNVGDRLDNASRVVADVQKGLGSLAQASERILEVGKDIAGLQEILRAPKLRGGLGELFLGDLLAQMLPAAHFTLQKKFRSGEAVDAVIHLGQGMVPVDSKFPLENFKRLIETQDETEKKAARRKFCADVKKHIDSVATKYILPDEGTFDFALMYIPAENVYYEIIIKDDAAAEDNSISTYALQRRVIPVSPNSFYAYVQAIVLGLRGMRIEKSAQDIIRQLARLKGDFGRFQEEFDILGKHITNIKNKYDDSAKRLSNFGDKLLAAGEEKPQELPGIEP